MADDDKELVYVWYKKYDMFLIKCFNCFFDAKCSVFVECYLIYYLPMFIILSNAKSCLIFIIPHYPKTSVYMVCFLKFSKKIIRVFMESNTRSMLPFRIAYFDIFSTLKLQLNAINWHLKLNSDKVTRHLKYDTTICIC